MGCCQLNIQSWLSRSLPDMFSATLAGCQLTSIAVCTQRCDTTDLPTRHFDHVTPLLRDLHWLKVLQRVAYKLAVIVCRCLHGMAPPYLCDSLRRVAELNRRRMRSSMSNALVVPAIRLITVGDS